MEGIYEYVIHKQVIRVNSNFPNREAAVKEATDLLKRYRDSDTSTEYWYELVREGESETLQQRADRTNPYLLTSKREGESDE